MCMMQRDPPLRVSFTKREKWLFKFIFPIDSNQAAETHTHKRTNERTPLNLKMIFLLMMRLLAD